MPNGPDNSKDGPATDHGEVFSSDAPGGPYDKSVYDPTTGHQTQVDTLNDRRVSRNWEDGQPNRWHPTDQTKEKQDKERHSPWW